MQMQDYVKADAPVSTLTTEHLEENLDGMAKATARFFECLAVTYDGVFADSFTQEQADILYHLGFLDTDY